MIPMISPQAEAAAIFADVRAVEVRTLEDSVEHKLPTGFTFQDSVKLDSVMIKAQKCYEEQCYEAGIAIIDSVLEQEAALKQDLNFYKQAQLWKIRFERADEMNKVWLYEVYPYITTTAYEIDQLITQKESSRDAESLGELYLYKGELEIRNNNLEKAKKALYWAELVSEGKFWEPELDYAKTRLEHMKFLENIEDIKGKSISLNKWDKTQRQLHKIVTGYLKYADDYIKNPDSQHLLKGRFWAVNFDLFDFANLQFFHDKKDLMDPIREEILDMIVQLIPHWAEMVDFTPDRFRLDMVRGYTEKKQYNDITTKFFEDQLTSMQARTNQKTQLYSDVLIAQGELYLRAFEPLDSRQKIAQLIEEHPKHKVDSITEKVVFDGWLRQEYARRILFAGMQINFYQIKYHLGQLQAVFDRTKRTDDLLSDFINPLQENYLEYHARRRFKIQEYATEHEGLKNAIQTAVLHPENAKNDSIAAYLLTLPVPEDKETGYIFLHMKDKLKHNKLDKLDLPLKTEHIILDMLEQHLRHGDKIRPPTEEYEIHPGRTLGILYGQLKRTYTKAKDWDGFEPIFISINRSIYPRPFWDAFWFRLNK